MNYLCCDLGGTTVDWGIYREKEKDFVFRTTFQTARYQDFYEMMDDVLIAYRKNVGESCSIIENTTLGIAGPTDNQTVRPTNLEGWEINTVTTDAILKDHGHIPFSSIINDFEAIAYGLLYLMERGLREDDFTSIYGRLKTGPKRVGEAVGSRSLICGPGTGLGIACLIDNLEKNGFPYIVSSEGGHRTLSPESQEQYRLLSHDGVFNGKLSYEAVISREGIRYLYNFFRREDYDAEPVYGITAEEITSAATSGKDQAATDAIELFCEILANFCGNSALMFNCDKSIFLWGGMLKLIPIELLKGRFKRCYADRSNHGERVARVPVAWIQNADVPLFGCVLRSRYEMSSRGD